MFKLGLAARIAAGVVLVGSLGYYNFIDKAPVSGAEKGNRCPDFTAQTYISDGREFSVSEETFTLSEQIGKICVLNFWETWCPGCIEELPFFNKIQKEYADEVEVIAIVGVTSTVESAMTWMNDEGWKTYDKDSDWKEFSLTFAHLPTANCKELGCGGMLPRTVIVDKSGIVAYAQNASMTYQSLQEIIEDLL